MNILISNLKNNLHSASISSNLENNATYVQLVVKNFLRVE